jgi:hypothetical protein
VCSGVIVWNDGAVYDDGVVAWWIDGSFVLCVEKGGLFSAEFERRLVRCWLINGVRRHCLLHASFVLWLLLLLLDLMLLVFIVCCTCEGNSDWDLLSVSASVATHFGSSMRTVLYGIGNLLFDD